MKRISLLLVVLFAFVTGFAALPAAAAAKTSNPVSASKVQKTVKIDINSADQAKLVALPGIGPGTADAIIAYRKKNGKFKNVDELLQVKGIGPKKLEKIKPFLNSI